MSKNTLIFIIFVIAFILFMYLLIEFYNPSVGDRFRFIIDLMVKKQLWRESWR